jgi:hypothetical protein
VRNILIVFRLVQAEEEDAARFEIALDVVGDVIDVISDSDISASYYGAVDYVFLSMWGWHVFEFGGFKS